VPIPAIDGEIRSINGDHQVFWKQLAHSKYWGNGDEFAIHVFDLSRIGNGARQPVRIKAAWHLG
jgi:hypothetical protein